MLTMAVFALRCYNYDMWWCVARTVGNSCQIQEIVDMGIFDSYRAYLRATFSVRSLCLVSFRRGHVSSETF